MIRPSPAGAGEDARRAGRAAERRLVREAQSGSGEALEALFKLHWPAAFRSAYYIVHDAAAAEDIAQEAFLAAVRALDRFDGRRPFSPWINRIVQGAGFTANVAENCDRSLLETPREESTGQIGKPTLRGLSNCGIR